MVSEKLETGPGAMLATYMLPARQSSSSREAVRDTYNWEKESKHMPTRSCRYRLTSWTSVSIMTRWRRRGRHAKATGTLGMPAAAQKGWWWMTDVVKASSTEGQMRLLPRLMKGAGTVVGPIKG